VGGIGGTFSSLAWVYLLGAGFTVYQLSRSWGDFWKAGSAPQARQMAGGVAFFLLVPIGVLLHELGHMLAAWLVGGQVYGLHYFVYWGYVEWSGGTDLQDWFVALAGNFVSYALGIGCLLAAVAWRSARPAIRITLAYLGILELTQTLIMYPLMSLDPGFYGDWDSIYSFRAPVASGVTLAMHAVSLVAFMVFIRANNEAKGLLGT
jgi:Peptidase M50B-like